MYVQIKGYTSVHPGDPSCLPNPNKLVGHSFTRMPNIALELQIALLISPINKITIYPLIGTLSDIP